MIDTKAKRAAALGYGLSFLLVLPPAHGALSIQDAGHALSAYQYDLPEAVIVLAHADFMVLVPRCASEVLVAAQPSIVLVPRSQENVTP